MDRLRGSPIHGLAPSRKGIEGAHHQYQGERSSNAEADHRYDDESMDIHHTFLFI